MSLLAACASGPPATYDLGAIGGGFSAKEARRGQLAVYEPTAVSPVDSDRIVVRTGADSVAYLSGAKWAGQLTSPGAGPPYRQLSERPSFPRGRRTRHFVGL